MKKEIITIGILILYFTLGHAQSKTQKASDILLELVKDKGIVGVTGAYSVNGELMWSDAKGFSSKEDQVAITSSTKLRTASIAKSMTAIAVIQLVEKGLLDLDVPIQTYLPDYPLKKKGAFTTRQLLSHTTGIQGYASTKEAQNKKAFASLEEAMHVFQDRDLAFEPGSQYSYTTYGYVVLGRLIEVISGGTYEDYMQKNIWGVIGMNDTGIEHTSKRSHHSSLYHKKRKKAKLAKRNNLSNRVPGGGFYSTVGDVLRFGNAILDCSLISQSSLDEMLKVASPGKEGNQYGFGFFLYGPEGQEGVVFGHSGGQTGASAQFFVHTRTKAVVVIMANTSGTWEHVAGAASMILNLSSNND